MDYYKVLGVDPNSNDVIKKAFRKLSRNIIQIEVEMRRNLRK